MDNLIKVSASGSSVDDSTKAKVLLDDKNPLAKLDSQNTVSFQNIRILFNNEPTASSLSNPNTKTLIYTFPHGYDYVSSSWLLWFNTNPNVFNNTVIDTGNTYNTRTTYYQLGDEIIDFLNNNSGSIDGQSTGGNLVATASVDISGGGIFTNSENVSLVTEIDKTSFNIYLIRNLLLVLGPGGTPVPVIMKSVILNIRAYVFVEDLGI